MLDILIESPLYAACIKILSPTFDKHTSLIFMSPSLGFGDMLFSPHVTVCLSVCLSHSCPLYNLKKVQAIFMNLHINISLN